MATTNIINQRRRDYWIAKAAELDKLAERSQSRGDGHEGYAEARALAANTSREIAALFDGDNRDAAKLLEQSMFNHDSADIRHIVTP